MNWALLLNSLLVAGGATFASLLLGSLGAIWLAGIELRWRRIFLGAAAAGLALPPFLVTNCWLTLLGQGGLWSKWITVSIYSRVGTTWVLALLFWPITLLLVLGALEKVQPSQLECEPALRGWPFLRSLLFPASAPALRQAAVLTFVLAFNNFAVPSILQTKVFPAELWVSFNTTFDYASALKLSWPLLVIPALLLWGMRRAAVAWPRRQAGLPNRLFRDRLTVKWFALAALAGGSGLIFAVGVPAAQLLLSSKTWLELPKAFAASHSALWHSAVFAACAATVCVGVGLTLWRWRPGAILWPFFFLPGVLLGIGLIFFFNRPPLIAFYQSAGIVVLALAIRYSALSWTKTRQSMQSLDRGLGDFAELQGATRWQRLRHVEWPQIGPELIGVWFITYLLCLWDVETLVLIIPPGCETLALRIFNLLHYGHNSQVNALCVLLLGLAVLPLAFTALAKAPTGSWRIVLGLCLAFLGSGCGPIGLQQADIQSHVFSKVQIIGTRGTALGQFNKPRSVAVDAHDNLYVVDMTGRVQKFSSNGVYLTSWQMPQTEKGKPKGMCRDRAGNILVLEPHYTRVNLFSPEGKLLSQWGIPGTNNGQLCLPRAVTVNSRGEILVCEYTLVDRLQVFSADGKEWRRTIGHSGSGPGEFNRPEGLAVDRADRIYVADSCNHRIQVFTPEGQFLSTYGNAGSNPGELSYPYDVQVDPTGLQFVAEFGNSRIQIFDAHGVSLEILGGPGLAPGQFSNPWSVALDSAGNLYVADSQNHRVQKFIRKAALTGSGA